MKNKSRVLALILAAGMLLSACSTNEGETSKGNESNGQTTSQQGGTESENTGNSNVNMDGYFPIVNEPITVTMSGRQGATKDWQSVAQIEFIKNEFGIDIQCEEVSNDAWETQLTLMFARDELTDIITNSLLTIPEANEYGADGYLIAFNEYLEYMPNFSAFLDEYPSYAQSITAADGNIYTIGKLIQPSPHDSIPRVFVNGRWLDNLGLEAPETLDELYNVLKAFKEQDANGNGDPNDEIPMNYVPFTYDFNDEAFLAAFGIHTKNRTNYITQVDENNQISLAHTTDEFKEYLMYMNKLYSEELIDQECYVMTVQEANARAAEDRYGFMGVSSPSVTAGQPKEWGMDFVLTPTFTLEEGDEKKILGNTNAITGAGIMLSSLTENPEALCRMIDYIFSGDKEMYLGIRGVEGETIEFVDIEELPGAASVVYLGQEESGAATAEEFKQQYSVIQGAFWLLDGPYGKVSEDLCLTDDDTFESFYNNYDLSLTYSSEFDLLRTKYYREEEYTVIEADPVAVYTSDETKDINQIKADIIPYLESTRAQFVTGELNFEEDWDNYINTLNNMGLEDLMALEQAALDRTLGS